MKPEDRLNQFRKLPFMQSRIPASDALSMFVPKGQENDPEVQTFSHSKGFSRWFPIDGGKGGHNVLIPHEGEKFDSTKVKIEKGGWDHEHCKICSADIEPMTLCWVTKSGPYVILCDDCHKRMIDKTDGRE
jgi:hypothetical protein